MGMFGIVCAANTITKDSTKSKNAKGKDVLGKGFLNTEGKDGGEALTNSTYGSVVGSSVDCVVGTLTSNVFGSERRIITNPKELVRIIYNNNEGGWGKFYGFLTNKGGGETKYLLGNLKELTYRFTPNFAVDRFWNNKGFIGHQHEGHVHDIHFKPLKSEKKFILLPALFSFGLLSFDLTLVYKLHFAESADITNMSADSIASGKNLNYRIILVTAILLAMGVFESACLLLIRILEKKFLYAVETLKKEIAKLKVKLDAAEKEAETALNAYSNLTFMVGYTNVEEQDLDNARTLAATANEAVEEFKVALANAVKNVESAWGTVDLDDHAYGGH